MKVTIEIHDYSDPAKPSIRVHSSWNSGKEVELEVEGKRYTVDGEELMSAVRRAMLNVFGR